MASNDEPRTSIEDLCDPYDTPMTSDDGKSPNDEPEAPRDDDESTASGDEPVDPEDYNVEDHESIVSNDDSKTSQDEYSFLDGDAQDSEPQEHNIAPVGTPGPTERRRLIGNIGFGVLQSFVHPERNRNVRKPQFMTAQPTPTCTSNPPMLTRAQLSKTGLEPSEGLKINFLREPLPRPPGPTTYVPVTPERRASIQRQRESIFGNVNSDTLAQDIALNIKGRSRGDERLRQIGQRRAALSATPVNRSLRNVTPALGSPEDKKEKLEAQESREPRGNRVAREVRYARAARQARYSRLAMLVSISMSIEGIKMARYLLDLRPAESSTNGASRETWEINRVRAALRHLLNNPGVVKRLPRPEMKKDVVSKPPAERNSPPWRKNAANWSPVKPSVTSTMAPPSRKRSIESSSPTSPTKKFKFAGQLSKDESVPKPKKQAKKLTADDVEIEGKYLNNEREGERSARLRNLRNAQQVSQRAPQSTSARYTSSEEALQALPQGTLDALSKKVHKVTRGQEDLAAEFMEVIFGMNIMNLGYLIPEKFPSTATSGKGFRPSRTRTPSVSFRGGAPSPLEGAADDRINLETGRSEQSEQAVSVKAFPEPEAIIGFRIEHHRWLQYKLGSHDQTDEGWLYAGDLNWGWNVHIRHWQETFPDNYQQLIEMEQYLIEFDTYKDRVVIGMTLEDDRGLNFEVSEAEEEEHLFFDGAELVED